MVRKSKTTATAGKKANTPLPEAVKESAQQIWLAGLGAFAKAQEEGGRMFEAFVKEGASIQHKLQAAAEERMTGAAHRMASMASDISSKASGQWDKLETIFEDRVSKALKRLGVPSAKDIDALAARIDELHRKVAELGAKPTAARRGGGAAAKGTAKRTAKRASPRKSV